MASRGGTVITFGKISIASESASIEQIQRVLYEIVDRLGIPDGDSPQAQKVQQEMEDDLKKQERELNEDLKKLAEERSGGLEGENERRVTPPWERGR